MTPLSLVFDARDAHVAGLDATVVPTLLGLDKHLSLSLAAPGSGVRWALGSDDFAASFGGM